jgi:membrane protease YdiL (CAAX protease family)
LVGLGLLTGTVAALAVIGLYRVEAVNAWTVLVPAFAVAVQAAWVEELLYRGVLLRVLDESLGTWPALAISAGFFGVVHLGTPNATHYTALAISLEAGLLLGAAYVLTRRLWLPIGIHFAWNFMQAGVFGGTRVASSLGVRSLLEAETSGPDLLSGGGSGLDGSIFAITLCVAVAAALLVLAHRRGRFNPPFWRR